MRRSEILKAEERSRVFREMKMLVEAGKKKAREAKDRAQTKLLAARVAAYQNRMDLEAEGDWKARRAIHRRAPALEIELDRAAEVFRDAKRKFEEISK